MPLRQHDRRIPRDLETLVQKALAKDPKDRFATAGELAATSCGVIWRAGRSGRGRSGRPSGSGGGAGAAPPWLPSRPWPRP